MTTKEILEQIRFEMDKMLGKSKTKMTSEQFRAFVSEQWELMGTDKYHTRGINILVGRMMNEAIWANDPTDLIKWIKEEQKLENFHNNSLEIKYNYYKDALVEAWAFAEGLAFFQEQNTPEAEPFVAFFRNILENPESMDFFDDNEDWEIGFSVELEQWAAFFEEEKAEIRYEILTKNGEETD